MQKSWLYRWFGLGKLPAVAREQIDREGLVLAEEGVSGSITFVGVRGPGRYHGWKRKWFMGAVVVTKRHLLGFQFGRPVIGLAWDSPQLQSVKSSEDQPGVLRFDFPAEVFHQDWSGEVSLRFNTALAGRFIAQIRGRSARH